MDPLCRSEIPRALSSLDHITYQGESGYVAIRHWLCILHRGIDRSHAGLFSRSECWSDELLEITEIPVSCLIDTPDLLFFVFFFLARVRPKEPNELNQTSRVKPKRFYVNIIRLVLNDAQTPRAIFTDKRQTANKIIRHVKIPLKTSKNKNIINTMIASPIKVNPDPTNPT